jgi:hypothetical protein
VSNENRELVMLKLLTLGPETLQTLVRVTGWGELNTRITLDTLIAQQKIRRFRRFRGSAAHFETIGENK